MGSSWEIDVHLKDDVAYLKSFLAPFCLRLRRVYHIKRASLYFIGNLGVYHKIAILSRLTPFDIMILSNLSQILYVRSFQMAPRTKTRVARLVRGKQYILILCQVIPSGTIYNKGRANKMPPKAAYFPNFPNR